MFPDPTPKSNLVMKIVWGSWTRSNAVIFLNTFFVAIYWSRINVRKIGRKLDLIIFM